MGFISDRVDRLTQLILHDLRRGELAGLRRTKPEEPGPAIFWKILARYVGDAVSGSGERGRMWACLFSCMVRAEDFLTREGVCLGTALAEARVEGREVEKLIRLKGPDLRKQVIALTELFVSEGVVVRWTDVAFLLVSDRLDWREDVRRKVSRDYYRVLVKGHKEEK